MWAVSGSEDHTPADVSSGRQPPLCRRCCPTCTLGRLCQCQNGPPLLVHPHLSQGQGQGHVAARAVSEQGAVVKQVVPLPRREVACHIPGALQPTPLL